MSELRIYLADDHPVFGNGPRSLIDAQPDRAVVGEAPDGETAVREVLAPKLGLTSRAEIARYASARGWLGEG